MHEHKLPLDYAVPASVSRAGRPLWVNVSYLVLGAASMVIAGLILLDPFRWVGHLEFYAAWIGCPVLLLLGLIFMTKGLAIFSEDSMRKEHHT